MSHIKNVRRHVFFGLIGSVVAVLAAAGVALAAGDSAQVTDPGFGDPVMYAASADGVYTQRIDASSAAEAALPQLPGLDVKSVAVGSGPQTSATPGKWFSMTFRVTSVDNGGALRPLWEGNLAQGVAADDLASTIDNSSGIVGSDFTAVLPDGATVSLGGGAGNVRTNQVFDVSMMGSTDSERVAAATNIVTKAGLVPISVDILHPKDAALSVIAKVPAGLRFTGLADLQMALTGTPAAYEGVYLEIQDAAGTRLAVVATAFRTGAGYNWSEAGQELGGPPHG